MEYKGKLWNECGVIRLFVWGRGGGGVREEILVKGRE